MLVVAAVEVILHLVKEDLEDPAEVVKVEIIIMLLKVDFLVQ